MMKKSLNLLFNIIIILIIPTGVAFAQLVPEPFLPGETLNPDCTPGEENCFVDISNPLKVKFQGITIGEDVDVFNLTGSDVNATMGASNGGEIDLSIGDTFLIQDEGALVTEDNISILNIVGNTADTTYRGGGLLDLNFNESFELIEENQNPYESDVLSGFNLDFLVGPNALGAGSLAIGQGVYASGEGSVGIGPKTLVLGKESVAVGAGSATFANNSIGIGLFTYTPSFGEVVVGVNNRIVTRGVTTSDIYSSSPSADSFNTLNRAFSVGIGDPSGMIISRGEGKNGFSVYKDEAVEFGDTSAAYSPTSFAGGYFSTAINGKSLSAKVLSASDPSMIFVEGDITEFLNAMTTKRAFMSKQSSDEYHPVVFVASTFDGVNTAINLASSSMPPGYTDALANNYTITFIDSEERNGEAGSAFAFGDYNVASNTGAAALGGKYATAYAQNSFASGEYVDAYGVGSVAFGKKNTSQSPFEFSIGHYGTLYSPTSRNDFSLGDRIFNVGNGEGSSTRSDAFTILKDGNVGINVNNFESNNPDDHAILHGNGAHLTANGDWVSVSDASKKQDIQDIKYGLSTILELEPRSFDYKRDGAEGIGFVAQELEQIIPEAVSGTDGSKGIRYGQLTAVLVQAVQELAGSVGEDAASSLSADTDQGEDSVDGEITENQTAEVRIIKAENISSEQLCLGDTCIDEQELKALLSLVNGKTETVVETKKPASQDLIDRINILEQLRTRRNTETKE